MKLKDITASHGFAKWWIKTTMFPFGGANWDAFVRRARSPEALDAWMDGYQAGMREAASGRAGEGIRSNNDRYKRRTLGDL